MMGHQEKVLAFKQSVFEADPDTQIDDYNAVQTEIISHDVYQSWQRSFDNGIYINDFVDDSSLQPDQLNDVLEQNQTIINLSSPELNKLYQMIKGAGNMVLLADKNGVILDHLGDAGFVDRASEILLTKGAKWGEIDKGTNAIGTAIKQDKAITIHGGEHYLNAHSFLTCASVPIHDPYGGVLGVLDITGDYRGGNPHTLALINMSVEHIECEMFNHSFHKDVIVELYCASSNHISAVNRFSGAKWYEKVIIVFSFSGLLIAANKCAMNQFGLTRQSLNNKAFEDIFNQKINGLIDHIILSSTHAYPLKNHSGAVYYAKAKSSYARLRSFTKPNETPSVLAINQTGRDECITFDHVDLGDAQMARNINKIKKIMPHDIPILLQGETGAGKGWIARAIHHESERANKPFIAVNCASMPRELIESELFGYVGGAFTGAKSVGYKGKILAADKGYLFLDEIGDMPLDMQSRLLRVLEDKQICPIGSVQNIALDINIISASNIDLKQAVEDGTFRRDLYYRLNGLAIKLPNLSEREDIEPLVAAILQREFPQMDIQLNAAVWNLFKAHCWPGNIRQMHHVLKVATLICDDDLIELKDLPDDFLAEAINEDEEITNIISLEDSEKTVIANMLNACDHNISKTAKKLGISRNTLYSKMRQYSL